MNKLLRPLKNLFQGRKSGLNGSDLTDKALPPELSYVEARSLLEERDTANHLALAARSDAPPEILYYLATDPSMEVRKEVARNPATPYQTDCILIKDPTEDVRSELARKIARLLPDISDQERSATRERMIGILEQLAQDQVPKIRQILAEELKSSKTVPYALIRQLAMDPVIDVASPVLEYSPLLSDDDLKEIIALSHVKGALTAIARRASVSAAVADSIAAALEVPAVAALLANPNADIREDTLNFIIDNAAAIDDWHVPLVQRPNLSMRLMRRISTFVASSLIDVMVRMQDLDPEDAEQLLDKVRNRILSEQPGAEDRAQVLAKVSNLHARGAIDEKFIIEAIETHRRDALSQALALMSDLSLSDVEGIIDGRNARRIVALAWRARLSMRTAFRIQAEVAHVPHLQLVNARDGVDYPMSPAQMEALMEPYLS